MSNDVTKATPNIAQFLASRQRQIEAALPKHLTADRLSRIALTAIRRTPKLMEADVASLFGAIMQCAQLGLEPGTRAHLVPFWNGRQSRYEVNFIPDYRGLIDLARRSGQIGPFYAFAVREHDAFTYSLGLNPDLVHVPAESNRGEITHFYAVARAKDNSWSQFDVMTREQVDAIRDRSKAKDSGPWVTDYEPMGCKTVVRRLCKFLPASVEILQAVQADEAAERGEQDTTSWIDGEFEVDEEETLRDKVGRKSEAAKQDAPQPTGDPATEEQFLDAAARAESLERIDYLSSISHTVLKGAPAKRVDAVLAERARDISEQENAA